MVDAEGVVVRRDVVATDPDVLSKWLGKHCSGLVRIVLETGPLSTFLYHGLVERGVPVLCICARHAKKALSARVNKSDVNDAESLAQLCRTSSVASSGDASSGDTILIRSIYYWFAVVEPESDMLEEGFRACKNI